MVYIIIDYPVVLSRVEANLVVPFHSWLNYTVSASFRPTLLKMWRTFIICHGWCSALLMPSAFLVRNQIILTHGKLHVDKLKPIAGTIALSSCKVVFEWVIMSRAETGAATCLPDYLLLGASCTHTKCLYFKVIAGKGGKSHRCCCWQTTSWTRCHYPGEVTEVKLIAKMTISTTAQDKANPTL